MTDAEFLNTKKWQKMRPSDIDRVGVAYVDKGVYIEGVLDRVFPAVLAENRGILNLQLKDGSTFGIKESTYPIEKLASYVLKGSKLGFWGRIELANIAGGDTGGTGSMQTNQPKFRVLIIKPLQNSPSQVNITFVLRHVKIAYPGMNKGSDFVVDVHNDSGTQFSRFSSKIWALDAKEGPIESTMIVLNSLRAHGKVSEHITFTDSVPSEIGSLRVDVSDATSIAGENVSGDVEVKVKDETNEGR